MSIALVVILFSVMLMESRTISEKNKKKEIAHNLQVAISELGIITHKYLMHHEKRMEKKWNLRYNSVAKILRKEKNDKMQSLRSDFIDFGRLFLLLARNYKVSQNLIQIGASQKKIDTAIASDDKLVSQLLITSQSIITNTSNLAKELNTEVINMQKLSNNFILILITILGIIVITTSLVVATGISTALNRLTRGAKIIGKGDLEHRVEIKTKDEIGLLANAFNKMVFKLAEANKELEAFAYSVSHDLRAPLRAIDGFSKIVAEDYGDKLDEDGQRQLGVIQNSARDMGKLIDDLLAFSRMGRKSLKKSKINMHTLADDVTDSLQLAEKKQRITLNIKELPSALGDRAMLREVLVNLLSNAMKFSRPKDKPAIEISGSIKGSESIYYVKDNGVGFDMKYKEKLFQVFQRLHSADEFEGTGIGLALVQRIVHRHGGRVWAESKVNKGATFYFSLPRAKSDQ